MSNIIKRGKKGIYWIYYYKDGRKCGESLYTHDYKEAKMFQKKKDYELLNAHSPYTENVAIARLCDEFLQYSKTNKAHKTYLRDVFLVKEFLKLATDLRLQFCREITPPVMESYKAKRKDTGIKASSINREIVSLKSMMSHAHLWRYIDDNPAKHVKYLKVDERKPEFFDKNEIQLLIREADNHNPIYKIGILLGIYTGCRLGECLNLKWQDIDLQRDIVRFVRTKSGKERIVPLNPELKAFLLTLKTQSEYLVGERQSLLSYSHMISRLIKKAGLKGSYHKFRHTLASQLVLAGVDLYVISKILGHHSPEITQIYAHLKSEFLKDSITRFSLS